MGVCAGILSWFSGLLGLSQLVPALMHALGHTLGLCLLLGRCIWVWKRCFSLGQIIFFWELGLSWHFPSAEVGGQIVWPTQEAYGFLMALVDFPAAKTGDSFKAMLNFLIGEISWILNQVCVPSPLHGALLFWEILFRSDSTLKLPLY